MQGKESKVTIQIKPNKAEVTSDDIFGAIFYRAKSTGGKARDEKNYGTIAKEIFRLIARKDHLDDSKATYVALVNQFHEKEDILRWIIQKMRRAGVVKKKGHIYVPSNNFIKYLRKMVNAGQNFFDDLGVTYED